MPIPSSVRRGLFQEYQMLASSGDPFSQTNLGWCWRLGFGVEKDPTKAIEWFTRAAEAGHVDAQFNLGVCYTELGNPGEAVKWFAKAGEAGHAEAQTKLEIYS